MISCITREDMKFGDYFIPARTKARVVNTPEYRNANVPGLQLIIIVTLFDFNPHRGTGVPISRVHIQDEMEPGKMGATRSQMEGIVIYTHADRVFLDAGDRFYYDATLGKWQVEKIFGSTIPEGINKAQYSEAYLLQSVVSYLGDEFAKWVQQNCHFRKLTKRDIENGDGFDGAEPGDKTLSVKGLGQFEAKQLEYQNRLEVTGWTYDFKGGLIWE